MTQNKPEYQEGDLIQIISRNGYTLCRTKEEHNKGRIIECPTKEVAPYTYPAGHYQDIIENLEGKAGLVVYVSRNKLQHPLGYRVLIEGHEMFYNSIVADKYFRLAENHTNETGGPSTI